jgi:hypothetical protein
MSKMQSEPVHVKTAPRHTQGLGDHLFGPITILKFGRSDALWRHGVMQLGMFVTMRRKFACWRTTIIRDVTKLFKQSQQRTNYGL